MANQASNFHAVMCRTWDTHPNSRGRTNKSHNAVERAKEWDAVRVGKAKTDNDHFINEPGDLPTSLWRFPDGSYLILHDGGHGMMKAGHNPLKWLDNTNQPT